MTDSVPNRRRAAKPTAKPTAAAESRRPQAALDPAALTRAVHQLMEPLAALAIAQGVPFAALEELLKKAFVATACTAHRGLPAHRMVSRISTVTGINRREVSRITQTRHEAPAVRHSPATRVFTKWLAEPSLQARGGVTMALPRQGPAPSFEALAHSVSRDVHPRSLLDELCRLGLARVEADTVHLARDRFVPKDDSARMLGFLGNNVGDHLRAAVANVASDPPAHLEQAVFADELSQESVDAFRRLMRKQWKTLLAAAVPALQKLIDDDRAAGRPQDQRVRVGLYTYDEPMPAAPDSVGQPPPTPQRKAARKPKVK
jgi:Family of unknown function (DUF6502)